MNWKEEWEDCCGRGGTDTMNNLFDYGQGLAEVFLGAYLNIMCKGLPEEKAVQIAYSTASIYATFNKPQPPIRIQLDPAPKEQPEPGEKPERKPKRKDGKKDE